MSFSETIRKYAFWAVDFLAQTGVRKHVQDLSLAFSAPEEAVKAAERRLADFLAYACRTTKFYRQFASTQIEDFPVVTKEMIKRNYQDFLSKAFNEAQLCKINTSGSYGTPFTFYLTKDKRARQQAEIIFFNQWAGYNIGDRYLQVRVHPRGKLQLFLQNGVLIDPSVIDDKWLERSRQLLKNENFKFMAFYPSAMLPLTEYCSMKKDKPDEFTIKGMVSNSEPLPESLQRKIENVFGCLVLDRYCSNELGVISHQCPMGKKHHVNLCTHKVELLDLNKDTPVEPGRLGRIVVTDMFSHAMPLIRYETGDMASWSEEKCPCGLNIPAFSRIGGRITETIYDPDGNIVHALGIDKDPRDIDGIVQFQFIQKSRDHYLLKLHVTADFDHEDTLRVRLQKRLGPKAHVAFEYVDSIPPLPSGKRPYILNEYRQTLAQ